MKVRTVPLQPHCFFFGGFDIQMHRTLDIMRAQGFDAQPLDFWSRDGDFDVMHCWGLEPMHQQIVKTAKQYNKKVMITALIPYLSLRTRIRHYGAMIEGRRRVLMDILAHTDRLCVHNELQVDTAVKLFGMDPAKVEIIPSILDPELFEQAPVPPLDDLRDYILCIGNIWPRKNQLRLAQAARQIECPMLFIGNLMAGEEGYNAEFSKLVEETPYFRWYRWVTEEDLRKALYNCVGVALPSFQETQPGAPLEGAAMGKPVLLGDRLYATQKYYDGAYRADPESVKSIAAGLASLRANPQAHVPPRDYVLDCHPDRIGQRFKKILDSLA
jgi:glycosyltransferase involved in cell wall biosynthesis